MTGQVRPYEEKRTLPVIAWDWMRGAVEREHADVPVRGTVAAGRPIEAMSCHHTVSIPKDLVGRFQTYALRVEGDSMTEENIRHGDHIVIQARETAENGETVVAMINNEEVTLKRLYIESDHIRLQPANPRMRPIILSNEDIRILGVVCAVIRKHRYH